MEEPKSFISPAGGMQQGWPVIIEFAVILGMYSLV
jgi:hypothetical protein